MRILAASALCAIVGSVAHAQLAPGQRIRISTAEVAGVVGAVRSVDSTHLTFTVADNGTAVRVPLADLSRLDHSEGIDRRDGVAIGTAVGGALGLWLFVDLSRDLGGGETFGMAQLAAAFPSLLVVGVGAAVGAVLAPERWRTSAIAGGTLPRGNGVSLHMNPGERVRIATAAGRRTARLTALDSVSITLTGGPALRWSDLQRLEVRGSPSRKRGVMRGAVVITAVTVIGIATDPLPSTGENIGVLISNAAIGGVVGAFFPMKRWIALPLPGTR